MIKSFKQKELEKFFLTDKGKIPQFAHKKKVKRILDLLDAVIEAEEMNYPGSNFHK